MQGLGLCHPHWYTVSSRNNKTSASTVLIIVKKDDADSSTMLWPHLPGATTPNDRKRHLTSQTACTCEPYTPKWPEKRSLRCWAFCYSKKPIDATRTSTHKVVCTNRCKVSCNFLNFWEHCEHLYIQFREYIYSNNTKVPVPINR